MLPGDLPRPSLRTLLSRLGAARRAIHQAVAHAGGRPVARRTAIATIGLALVAAFVLPALLGRPTRPAGRDDVGRLAPVESPAGPWPAQRPESAGPALSAPGFREAKEAYDREMAVRRAASAVPATAPGADLAWGRRIIRRAVLELETSDVERSLARLTDVVESAGGYVAGTEAQTDAGGTVRARITLYVPPDRFGRVVGELDGAGRVTARRVSGDDVSEEFVDLEARVRNLERHEAQLVGFMTRAQKVSDLLAIETELARVRGEIERHQGRVRFLRARTEMASIQVNLTRVLVPAAPDGGLARVWGEIVAAFRDAWLAAFRVATDIVLLAARTSPLVVLLLVGWAAYRRWARRRISDAAASA